MTGEDAGPRERFNCSQCGWTARKALDIEAAAYRRGLERAAEIAEDWKPDHHMANVQLSAAASIAAAIRAELAAPLDKEKLG